MEVKKKRISLQNNATTELRYLAHKNATKGILILPALGVSASYYDVLMEEFHKEGYAVASVDFHGQGNSSIKASRKQNFGYKELLEVDITNAIACTKELFGKPLLLFGHSLGGQMAALYTGQYQSNIDALILCISGSVYYKSWTGVHKLRVLLGTQVSMLIGKIMGYFPGNTVGFGGNTGKQLIMDWGNQARTGSYQVKNSTINWEEGLKNITLPVLAISLKKDFLAPKEALHHLYSKMTNTKVEHKVLDLPSLNHFNWARKPSPILQEVLSWDLSYSLSNN